jgi:uncharacterized damage-inducible protein DinB
MSEQASIIQENAEFLFTRLFKTVEGVTQEESEWKPTPESNNIIWQLNHLSRIINLNMPRLIKEDHEWTPKNWQPNYKEAVNDIEKLIQDIEHGKPAVLSELGNLSKAQLEKETKYWGGTRKHKEGLFAYLAEIAHHKGQIAYIRATYARLQGKKWQYP